jgi:hypothetical protein
VLPNPHRVSKPRTFSGIRLPRDRRLPEEALIRCPAADALSECRRHRMPADLLAPRISAPSPAPIPLLSSTTFTKLAGESSWHTKCRLESYEYSL